MSSQTTNLLITQQDNGSNSNTWGTVTNANFETIDRKIGDVTTIATTSGTVTLSSTQELVNVIKCTATLVGNLTLEFSGRGGSWIVWNATSGSYTVTALVNGQTGVEIDQGAKKIVFCDGTDVRSAGADFTSGDDNLFTAAQSITLSAAGTALSLVSTDAGASSGPDLVLHRNSASPADSDVLASILFDGEDDGSTQTTYARIKATAADVTDATEDGTLVLAVMAAGTLTDILTVSASGVSISGALVEPGASRASFCATKSGSQSGINLSAKVTFDTEAFDVGSHYSSNRWTPPAGTCTISASLQLTNYTPPDGYVKIYKNGAEYISSGIANHTITIVDQCNGTDYYEVYVFASDSSYAVSAGAVFCGSMS